MGLVKVVLPQVIVWPARPSKLKIAVPLWVMPLTIIKLPYIVVAVVLAHAGVLVTPVQSM